jgi:hypothetical protein
MISQWIIVFHAATMREGFAVVAEAAAAPASAVTGARDRLRTHRTSTPPATPSNNHQVIRGRPGATCPAEAAAPDTVGASGICDRCLSSAARES